MNDPPKGCTQTLKETLHHILSHLIHIRFTFAKRLCVPASERKSDAEQAGRVITVIVGLCCFFGCCFSGLLYWVAALSVGPAAVYYSSDLICLTDDWGDMKSLLSAGARPGSGGGDGGNRGWLAADQQSGDDGYRWKLSVK